MKTNTSRKIMLITLICMLMLTLCACNNAIDATPNTTPNTTPSALPETSALTPEEIGGTTPEPTINVTYDVEEIDKVETPEQTSQAAYPIPSSIDSFLATASCFARGTVTKVTEYKMTSTTDDGQQYDSDYYFTAVEMDVI